MQIENAPVAGGSPVTWNQSYLLLGHGLGFSFLLATLPILGMLFLLGILRLPAWSAALCSLVGAFLLAILAYHMPVRTAISAAGLGAAFGLFPISWIIFWAIALFRVTVEAGQFDVIRKSIGRVTPDPRLQALLIAFAFGGFLEGAAGFGTPVAIAATMLVGLGFSPFSASAICLLANTAPVAFGSIGIPVVTLAETTGLSLARLSADVGAICTPIAILLPAYLMYALGGAGVMSGIWLPTLLAGAVFGLTQLAVSIYLGPQLADILAALSAMLVLVVLVRFQGPARSNRDRSSVLARFTQAGSRLQSSSSGLLIETPGGPAHTLRETLFAWMPYGLLVVCVLLWGWAPLHRAMDTLTVVVRWPLLHDVVRRMPPIVSAPSPYHALFTVNWLSAAGTACMVATLLSVVCLRMHPRTFLRILRDVVLLLRVPTLTVVTVLAIAFLMNYCGATATLGLGFAATGRLFPLFSALLGWVGVFLTGSDTSSNALFGNLQVVTAGRLGFGPVLMAAANSAGGVMGKMISLQSIAIAAAATGLSSAEQVRLFRFTLRHSVILALLTGCIVLLYVYVFRLA
jgi:L-lactate transport